MRLLLFAFYTFFGIAIAQAQQIRHLHLDSLNNVETRQRLSITMSETPSAGYTWHCTVLDSNYSKLLYKVQEYLKRGDSDYASHVFEYQTVEEGKVVLLFELYRDWEGREMAIQQHSIPIQIQYPRNVKELVVMRGNTETPKSISYDWEDANASLLEEFHKNSPSVLPRGKHVFDVKKTFVVDLENRIPGAIWKAEVEDNEIVTLISDRFFSKEEVAYSMNGLHAFKFKARSAGETKIRFTLILPDGEIAKSNLPTWEIVVTPEPEATVDKP